MNSSNEIFSVFDTYFLSMKTLIDMNLSPEGVQTLTTALKFRDQRRRVVLKP
jgi:hypothetical protein